MDVLKNPIPRSNRTPFLFLLIGKNPLPNFVAACLLWERQQDAACLFLVCSQTTRKVADRLVTELNIPVEQYRLLQISETNPLSIYGKVQDAAKPIRSAIGLNYTGGTKAMAVHAHRAIQDMERACVFSYLDAGSTEMVIENSDGTTRRYPVNGMLNIDIETMIKLHGYQFNPSKKKNVDRPQEIPDNVDFLRLWSTIDFKVVDEWVKKNIKIFNPQTGLGETRPENELAGIELPVQGEFAPMGIYWESIGAKNIRDLCEVWDGGAGKHKGISWWVKWMHTYWLEDYVLWIVREVSQECGIHAAGKNLLPFDHLKPLYNTDFKFEVDVYAIRGFQLFGLSCSTEDKIRDLKLKLFEARVRTTQIGGDESFTALVCMAGENLQNGCPKLKRQLKESWDDFSNRVEVIGNQYLGEAALKERLIKWFTGGAANE